MNEIANYYKDKDPKIAKNLKNGIFILFHDISHLLPPSEEDIKEFSIDCLQTLLRRTNDVVQRGLFNVFSLLDSDIEKYKNKCKKKQKDWEFLLKEGHDQIGKPFLRMNDIGNGQKKLFPFAQKPDGTIFVFNPYGDYQYADQIKGYTILENQKMVPKDIKKERYTLKRKILPITYQFFWNTFSHHINQYCKKYGNIFDELSINKKK